MSHRSPHHGIHSPNPFFVPDRSTNVVIIPTPSLKPLRNITCGVLFTRASVLKISNRVNGRVFLFLFIHIETSKTGFRIGWHLPTFMCIRNYNISTRARTISDGVHIMQRNTIQFAPEIATGRVLLIIQKLVPIYAYVLIHLSVCGQGKARRLFVHESMRLPGFDT